MKLINADTVVHWQSYDDEHETFQDHEGTIAEFLDAMTDEGCPKTVDAVPVRHGRWMEIPEAEMFMCSECGEPGLSFDDVYIYDLKPANFCPNCGADMRKGGDYEQTQKPE